MEIKNDLSIFGLSLQEQEVYLLLLRHGWSTVIQLAKLCPTKRTTLYRILDILVEKGLVVTEVEDKTTLYDASPATSFESLILESKKKTSELEQSFEHIKQYLSNVSSAQITDTRVRYYKGLRGLKQMDWNMVEKPNREILAFDSDKWAKILGTDFAEQKRAEAVKMNIRYLCIQNFEDTIAPDGTTSWTANTAYTKHHYRHRLIAKKIMDIKQDMYVRSDSIYFRGVRGNDIVAVQIINSDYARMMGQLFDVMWSKARAIDNFGNRFGHQ